MRIPPSRLLGAVLWTALTATAAAGPLTPESQTIYETKVKPFLAAHCLKCHDDATTRAGFRIDTLGTDFLAAVEETTRRIKRFPEAGPIERASIRKRLVVGFPFAVLYGTLEERLLIVAVMHQHRRPGYWRDRVPD